jgi:hypothetical protein
MNDVGSYPYYTNDRGFIVEITLTQENRKGCMWFWRWNGTLFEYYDHQQPDESRVAAADRFTAALEPCRRNPLIAEYRHLPGVRRSGVYYIYRASLMS